MIELLNEKNILLSDKLKRNKEEYYRNVDDTYSTRYRFDKNLYEEMSTINNNLLEEIYDNQLRIERYELGKEEIKHELYYNYKPYNRYNRYDIYDDNNNIENYRKYKNKYIRYEEEDENTDIKENSDEENEDIEREEEDEAENESYKAILKRSFNKLKNNELSHYSDNEVDFFDNLEEDLQKYIKSLEKLIKTINLDSIPDRFKILMKDIPIANKANIIKKFDEMSKNKLMLNGDNTKFKNWINGLLKIPFGRYINMPISKENTLNEIYDYIKDSKDILDKAVYGHKKTKNQILQLIAQWISNPESCGSIIGIQGPMGNGKTTLVKEGISKALKRPFEFISLGGASDASLLEGHGYTFEGSTWGKITDALMRHNCVNPVFYFDELDKVSKGYRGEEIINLLIHITDTTQNTKFQDRYFGGIDIDLSRCVFIFSFNDVSRINPILLDRLTLIETDGFSIDDKLNIFKKYLYPRICKKIGISEDTVVFSNENVKYIIDSHTEEEKGVRSLNKCTENIISVINLLLLTNDKELLDYDIDVSNKPIKITEKIINEIIEKKDNTDFLKHLYI